MKDIQILNAEPKDYSEPAKKILRSLGELTEIDLDRDMLIETVEDFHVLIVRLRFQVDQEILSAAKKLKVIVSATTGLDHIDLKTAEQKNISVLSLRGEKEFLSSVTATAEHTFALLFALLRNIPAAFASVKAGNWDRDSFKGHEIDGKRLGIVGLGRLGVKVAHYGQAFGMQVFSFDPHCTNPPDGVTICRDLPELLRQSEILSIHIPLNYDTQGMFGMRELDMLPRGAIVINTARGAVLDSPALLDALQSGHLSGAALDVVQKEPDHNAPEFSQVIDYARAHHNLLLTPHIGGATYESMEKTEYFMAEKLKHFLTSRAST